MTRVKTESEASVAKDVDKRHINVCMHSIGKAKFDARIMRDAMALRENGFSVTIVDIDTERIQPAEEDIKGIHFKHLRVPKYVSSERFKPWFPVKLPTIMVYSTFQLLRVQADIYHAHVEDALLACYIAAILRRKPFIVDTPELTLSDPHATRWPWLIAPIVHIIRYIVSSCSGYITASPLFAQELSRLYGAKEVTLIRNVPYYQEVPKSDRLRQHLGLGLDIRIALYQGNLQPNRRLDLLVHAASFLEPNIVIVMMGSARKTTLDQLEDLIVSKGVADRVRIIPSVPYEELLTWTASADIGLTIFQPDYSRTIQFCLPNKLFEYLMAGLPVLSSQLDAIAEVIKTYDVGQLLPSVAPSDIGAAINAMLADTSALTRMRRNALEAAKQEFNWEKESLKLIHLYQNILQRGAKKKSHGYNNSSN